MRVAPVNGRRARPTSMGTLAPSRMAGRMPASQARRRVASGVSRCAGVQLPDGYVALQGVVVDGDDDLGGLSAGGGQFSGA